MRPARRGRRRPTGCSSRRTSGGRSSPAARRDAMTAAAPSSQQDSVWSERDTTPAKVEEALRRLLRQRHGEDAGYVAGRALNMVCIVEGEWAGEVINRLDRTGRFHPSRTIILAVEPRRRKMD